MKTGKRKTVDFSDTWGKPGRIRIFSREIWIGRRARWNTSIIRRRTVNGFIFFLHTFFCIRFPIMRCCIYTVLSLAQRETSHAGVRLRVVYVIFHIIFNVSVAYAFPPSTFRYIIEPTLEKTYCTVHVISGEMRRRARASRTQRVRVS